MVRLSPSQMIHQIAQEWREMPVTQRRSYDNRALNVVKKLPSSIEISKVSPGPTQNIVLPSGISIKRVQTHNNHIQQQPGQRQQMRVVRTPVRGRGGSRRVPNLPLPPEMRANPMMSAQRRSIYRPNEPKNIYGDPIPPAEIAGRNTNCRLCGEAHPKSGSLYALSERPQYVRNIESVLGLKIDPERDESEGMPGVICRKCCFNVTSFTDFKRKVKQGQDNLSRWVQVNNREVTVAVVGNGTEHVQDNEESVVSDPFENDAPGPENDAPNEESESILPDLDMDVILDACGENIDDEEEGEVPKPVQIKAEKIEIKDPETKPGGGVKREPEPAPEPIVNDLGPNAPDPLTLVQITGCHSLSEQSEAKSEEESIVSEKEDKSEDGDDS